MSRTNAEKAYDAIISFEGHPPPSLETVAKHIVRLLDEKDKECRAKLGDMNHRIYNLCETSGLHAHTKREGDMLVCEHCGAGVIAPDMAEKYGFKSPSTDSQ